LLVNNIFSSIQGESIYSGFPTTFIRFTGCNLKCDYCDTTYAYEEGEELNTEAIMEQVEKLNNNYVCLTGGEPLLQEDVQQLINELTNYGYQISIETNGTVALDQFNLEEVKVVMDLKLPSSGEYRSELNVIDNNIRTLNNKDDLKFVTGSREDFQLARDLVIEKELQEKINIIFSPVFGQLSPEILVEWLVEETKLNQCRLQLQLHKVIWDEETKGV